MGSKNSYLILLMLSFHFVLSAQGKFDFLYADTTSYKYYNQGEWDKLITIGKNALDNNIDYKYLRQRIGFAYFMKGNYNDAKHHFQKALSFDSFNQFTLEYLYYSYLNTGKEESAGFIAGKLNPGLRKGLSLKSFKLLESIESEYNYKFATAVNRSNPQYLRLGIGTKLSNRLTLYQSVSNYSQVIYYYLPGRDKSLSFKQPEYYVLLKYAVSDKFLLKTSYHYFGTDTDTSLNNGNSAFLAVSKDINRFSFEAFGSVLTFGQGMINQAGFQAGLSFPGKSNFTLTSTLSEVFQQNSSSFVFNQKAGLIVLKKSWIECNTTFGRLTNYNDYNGLYLYNTIDPVTFRSGASMYIYLNKNITLWLNYSFEIKEYYENSSFQYNQFSYLGGIRWKL